MHYVGSDVRLRAATGGDGAVSETRIPAECFPVSSFVIEEMDERGWSREHLAEMTRWSHAALDALL